MTLQIDNSHFTPRYLHLPHQAIPGEHPYWGIKSVDLHYSSVSFYHRLLLHHSFTSLELLAQVLSAQSSSEKDVNGSFILKTP